MCAMVVLQRQCSRLKKSYYLFPTMSPMRIELHARDRCETFTMMFQHLKLFTEHINLIWEPERLYIQTMDRSHVSIVELILPATWFDTYQVETSQVMGLPISLFFNALNTRKDNNGLVLEKRDNEDGLRIHIRPLTSNLADDAIFHVEYEIPLFQIEQDTLHIPDDIEYQADIVMKSADFASLIHSFKLFDERWGISCNETQKELRFHATSSENGKSNVVFNIDHLVNYSVEENAELEVEYSVALFQRVVLYQRMSENVEIHVSSTFPMKIVYKIGVEEDSPCLIFYVAAMVTTD